MDKVIDFNNFKTKKELTSRYFAHSGKGDDFQERLKLKFVEATEEILERWRQHAVDDSLNQLILDTFRDRLIDRSLDYTSDLNAIAKLESHMHMSPLILGPGSTTGNSVGWGAGFYLNGLLIATPEFNSEVYARCFNLLLYMHLRYGKKKLLDS